MSSLFDSARSDGNENFFFPSSDMFGCFTHWSVSIRVNVCKCIRNWPLPIGPFQDQFLLLIKLVGLRSVYCLSNEVGLLEVCLSVSFSSLISRS